MDPSISERVDDPHAGPLEVNDIPRHQGHPMHLGGGGRSPSMTGTRSGALSRPHCSATWLLTPRIRPAKARRTLFEPGFEPQCLERIALSDRLDPPADLTDD